MTSTFTFNEIPPIPLKSDTVTPMMLQAMFGIDNMMLTDKEGNPHISKDGKFEPPLISDKLYTVHKLPPSQTKVNDEKDKQIVALIENAKENLRLAVTDNSFVVENTGLLMNAIHAPFLINMIAILSRLGPDPSLESKNMSIFYELKTPGSFQACLCQVANAVCSAYETADSSMYTIKTILSDLPDYLARIFGLINDPNLNEGGQKTLKNQLSQIKTSNDKCKTAAENAHKSVSGVVKLLNELHQASIAMNSANIAQVKENEKRKTVLSMEQKDRDQETKELANEAAKAAANRDKAKEIYHEQIQSNKAIFSVLATTAAEGVRDYVNGVGTKEALNLASKALGENGLAQIFAKEKESSPDISTKELALLQTLDIGSVASLKTPEAIASKIVYLKEFEKNTFSTPEGVSIKRKVTEFREKLESHGTDENLDSSLQGIKDSISGSINVYLKSLQERQMQQSKTKEAELSLHQQIFKSDAEKTQASQRVYEKEIENAEKIRKELSEKKDKLREIIIELQNITVSTDDLTGCIKFIEKVLGHLGQIEENWGNLVKFFDQIHTQIEHKLHKHVEEFGQHVEINYSQEFMLESAIKATAFIIQVLNCAEIYNATSQKLIMPVIRGINNQLNLTPEKAKVKQSEAHVKLNEAERNLEMLIESKKQEFNDRVSEQIKEFITKIQKAVQQSRNIGN